ncbi:MAG: hypothetical protein WCG95_06130, partial [bacterium]
TLKDKGIVFILNSDYSDYKPEEKQLVENLGMEYTFKPYCPSKFKEGILELKTLVQEIQLLLEKGGVYIHNNYYMKEIVAGHQHFIQKLPEAKILKYGNTSYGHFKYGEDLADVLKIFKSTEA